MLRRRISFKIAVGISKWHPDQLSWCFSAYCLNAVSQTKQTEVAVFKLRRRRLVGIERANWLGSAGYRGQMGRAPTLGTETDWRSTFLIWLRIFRGFSRSIERAKGTKSAGKLARTDYRHNLPEFIPNTQIKLLSDPRNLTPIRSKSCTSNDADLFLLEHLRALYGANSFARGYLDAGRLGRLVGQGLVEPIQPFHPTSYRARLRLTAPPE